MPNSIRTPKQGTSATSKRIAEAVDDEEWQKFRLSLKGISTQAKLGLLQTYWSLHCMNDDYDDLWIRVDNYLKALARGGQIEPVRGGEYVAELLTDRLVIQK